MNNQAAAGGGGDEQISVENPPLIIVFTAEQKEALRGTPFEGSRGVSLTNRQGIFVAEQLA
jgi:hypothetical protein